MSPPSQKSVYSQLPPWLVINSMKQQKLAAASDEGSGFEQYRKPTRRDEFLKAMDTIVLWKA